MAETSTTRSSNPLKAKLARYFRAHGQFCARHPWEVIVSVVTLTVCMLSIGVLSGGKVGTFCGLNKQCEEEEEEEVRIERPNRDADIPFTCTFVSETDVGCGSPGDDQQPGSHLCLQSVQQSQEGRVQIPPQLVFSYTPTFLDSGIPLITCADFVSGVPC